MTSPNYRQEYTGQRDRPRRHREGEYDQAPDRRGVDESSAALLRELYRTDPADAGPDDDRDNAREWR
jgi:hypothetical protein